MFWNEIHGLLKKSLNPHNIILCTLQGFGLYCLLILLFLNLVIRTHSFRMLLYRMLIEPASTVTRSSLLLKRVFDGMCISVWNAFKAFKNGSDL